jgi:ABC-type Co2+ transport system permease subunit
MSGFDFSELIKRAIKYIVEGIIVALAAYVIPKKSLSIEEVIVISLTAAATFSLLDVFIPSMGVMSRNSAAAGIGLGLIGGVPIAPM